MFTFVKSSALPLFLFFLLFLIRYPPGAEERRHAFKPKAKELLKALETDVEKVVSESVAWTGYARVYSRTVAYADGRPNATFDVWGRTWRGGMFGVAIAVPFVRKTRSFTLVREFCVAHNRFVYSFPAGQVESKHKDAADAAVAELDEEARLVCRKPMRELVKGAPQDKFQREAVHYYLCDDAVRKRSGFAMRDKEELIDIVPGVRVEELLALVSAGAMQSNMIAAAMLAIHDLTKRGLL